jgi:hypothetical protein
VVVTVVVVVVVVVTVVVVVIVVVVVVVVVVVTGPEATFIRTVYTLMRRLVEVQKLVHQVLDTQLSNFNTTLYLASSSSHMKEIPLNKSLHLPVLVSPKKPLGMPAFSKLALSSA